MNNKKLITTIALDLKLKLTNDVIEEINEQWSFFSDSLKTINLIDTTNVDKMFSPNFSPINYLREDILEENTFNKSVIFKNTKISKGQFIVIKKVIK